MPEKAKECLLNLFNQLWQSNFFPQTWREAVVIAFPKPNKTPSNAENYRPIALTSCLCKILERLFNNRLYDYCDMFGHFASVQCGGKRDRATADHLVRLETCIRRAFVHNEDVSILFDLQKAYDTRVYNLSSLIGRVVASKC